STATICSIEKRLRFMANHLLVQGQVCRKTRSRIGPGFLTQINPQLTLFCSELTGITQHDVDAAPLFPVAADELRAFVAKHQQAGSVWVSWGAYDRKQLERDSARHSVAMPIALPHQNVKRLFARRQRIGKEVGMVKACELVGLTLAGTHHRALDDALNVARLLPWALSNPVRAAGVTALKGVIPKPTRPVMTDEMREALGLHIEGEWIAGSSDFTDEGRSEQQQAERQRDDEIRKNDIG
ncbi:3'-5' exonuclease, partial [Burkholderia gladioli]|uniref:3'-5' exonuclease n=1 Tax=Burkholderia gladioli TaxID=28095 RepID=UPI0016404DCC